VYVKVGDIKQRCEATEFLVATCKCEYQPPKLCLLNLFGKFGPDKKIMDFFLSMRMV